MQTATAAHAAQNAADFATAELGANFAHANGANFGANFADQTPPAPPTPSKFTTFFAIVATLAALGAFIAFHWNARSWFYALFAALAVLIFATIEPNVRAEKLTRANAVYKRGSLLGWFASRLFLARLITLVFGAYLASTLAFTLAFPNRFEMLYFALLVPLSLTFIAPMRRFFATQYNTQFTAPKAKIQLAKILAVIGVALVFVYEIKLAPTAPSDYAMRLLGEGRLWEAIAEQRIELLSQYSRANLDPFLSTILSWTLWKDAAFIIASEKLGYAVLYFVFTAFGAFGAFYGWSLAILSANLSWLFAGLKKKIAADERADDETFTRDANGEIVAQSSGENQATTAPNSNLAHAAHAAHAVKNTRAGRVVTFAALYFAALVIGGYVGGKTAAPRIIDTRAPLEYFIGKRLLVEINDNTYEINERDYSAAINQVAQETGLDNSLKTISQKVIDEYFAKDKQIVREFSDWNFGFWNNVIPFMKDDANEKLAKIIAQNTPFDPYEEYVRRAARKIDLVFAELEIKLAANRAAEEAMQNWHGEYLKPRKINANEQFIKNLAHFADINSNEVAAALVSATAATLVANSRHFAKAGRAAGIVVKQAAEAGGRALGKLGAARLGTRLAKYGKLAKGALTTAGKRAAATPCVATGPAALACAAGVFVVTELAFHFGDKALHQKEFENKTRTILTDMKNALTKDLSGENIIKTETIIGALKEDKN